MDVRAAGACCCMDADIGHIRSLSTGSYIPRLSSVCVESYIGKPIGTHLLMLTGLLAYSYNSNFICMCD